MWLNIRCRPSLKATSILQYTNRSRFGRQSSSEAVSAVGHVTRHSYLLVCCRHAIQYNTEKPLYSTRCCLSCYFLSSFSYRSFSLLGILVVVIVSLNDTFGDRSFGVAGPHLWNDLSKDLRNTGLSITSGKHLSMMSVSCHCSESYK